MHYSIEARVPFLDHRVAEYAFNIHPSLKIKNGVAKYPLKQILYKHLPKEIFDRPKQGFSVPLAKWLKKEWAYLIDDYLTEENVLNAGFVRYEYVRQCIERFRSGDAHLYNRLWNLIVLHRWFLKHK
jgi:asparagine synthase (glutamine-hydrolysing)